MTFASCAQKEQNTAETPEETLFSAELVVRDLDIPWGMAFLPDGSMLITEKAGTLIHFRDGEKTEIQGVPPVYVRGQGGLMDIELHPNYAANGWIYLSYASEEGEEKGGNTAIARAMKLNKAYWLNISVYPMLSNTSMPLPRSENLYQTY